MASANGPEKPSKELMELTNRVQRLEDEVFKKPPGGLGERLRKIDDELVALQKSSTKQIKDLDDKIEQVIRIVAELRKVLEQPGGATATA
jgi:hypothetical protein